MGTCPGACVLRLGEARAGARVCHPERDGGLAANGDRSRRSGARGAGSVAGRAVGRLSRQRHHRRAGLHGRGNRYGEHTGSGGGGVAARSRWLSARAATAARHLRARRAGCGPQHRGQRDDWRRQPQRRGLALRGCALDVAGVVAGRHGRRPAGGLPDLRARHPLALSRSAGKRRRGARPHVGARRHRAGGLHSRRSRRLPDVSDHRLGGAPVPTAGRERRRGWSSPPSR